MEISLLGRSRGGLFVAPKRLCLAGQAGKISPFTTALHRVDSTRGRLTPREFHALSLIAPREFHALSLIGWGAVKSIAAADASHGRRIKG